MGAWLGARIFRAHDVPQTRQALDMVASIKGDRPPAADHARPRVIVRAAICPSPPLLARS